MKEGSDFNLIAQLGVKDTNHLELAQKTYGDSWRSRGGVGAFMMLARKWDRLENQCKEEGYDVFSAIAKNPSNTGVLDDIRDLRRYLLLVEAHMLGELSADKNG
jgi:hypothetical protein